MKFRPTLESLVERIVPDATPGPNPDPNQPPANPAQPANPPQQNNGWQSAYDEYQRLMQEADALGIQIDAAAAELNLLSMQYFQMRQEYEALGRKLNNGGSLTPEEQQRYDLLRVNMENTRRSYDDLYAQYINLRDQYNAVVGLAQCALDYMNSVDPTRTQQNQNTLQPLQTLRPPMPYAFNPMA